MNDHRNLTYFGMAQTLNHRQARWSLYLSQFSYSLTHRASKHLAKPNTLSRRIDHQVEGEDNKGQVMLPTKCFASQTHRPVNQPDPLDERLQAKDTGTEPSHVHIETGGSEIMDRVCGCTDQDELVVHALKELGLGADLWGNEWEEWDGLVLFRGKVYIPLDAQPQHDLWNPTMTPR